MAIAKSVWCGGTIYVNRSISAGLFSGYCGTSNFTISGLLNSDITIQTAGTTNLNIGTGSTTAMTIDCINTSIYGISSLTATTLSATTLYGLIGTAAQTSITSLGTLTGLTVSGTSTLASIILGATSITATGTEINYLDLTTGPGTAEASKALVLNSSRNIVNINSITSSYLTISTAINSTAAIASFLKVDLNNPTRVLGRLRSPLFSPESPWEKRGVTNNVVFPTGGVVRDKRLYIYYGAADKLIAAKSADLAELLTELKKR